MVLSLQDYMAKHSNDLVLSNAAGAIFFSVDGLPYASNIKVLDEETDLSILNPGYYLRFQNRGHGAFHLYGIEVIEQGNLVIHENIPRHQLSTHSDKLFLPQLVELNIEGRVLFRIATQSGGGADLHEDLAKQYATVGSVGVYLNSNLAHADNLPLSMASFVLKNAKQKKIARASSVDLLSESEQLDSARTVPKKVKVLAKDACVSITSPIQARSVNDNEERTASNTLMLAAGVLTASIGLSAIIIGALSLASIITVFAPPVGIALIVAGAIALAAGGGVTFFGSRSASQNEHSETTPLLDSNLDLS